MRKKDRSILLPRKARVSRMFLLSRKYGLGLLALVSILLLGGCASREHLDSNFGIRTRAFLAKQRVYPTAAVENPKGLDSEEAAIIHGNYRTQLGSKECDTPNAASSRVLVLEEGKDANNKK